MNRYKIQLHLPNLYIGGIERWALTLLNGLPEFDWHISTPPGALSHQSGLEEFRKFNIIDECNSGIEFDALITTWGTSNQSVSPTIAVAHSAFEKYKVMMRSVRYDFAVAVSREAKSCFPGPAPVEIIYNGVDISRLKAVQPRHPTRARLGIQQDAVVIGYVGRWGFQKNPLAAAKAAGAIPGAVALYVGPAPDDPKLIEEANRLAKCCFVAPEDAQHIGDLYRAMDVCLFASRTEGFGLVIAEAWTCGVPVVATNVGIAAEHPDLVQMLPDEPSEMDLKIAVEGVLHGKSAVDLKKCAETVINSYSAERMIQNWRQYILSKVA
jgi:glycosyltransferase involved in cell wall biosynthesis